MTALIQLPFEQRHPLEAAPQLRALQARGSIHKIRTATGDPAWLVTGYQDVQRLLADPRLGRSHPDPDSAARTGESALFGGPLGNYQTEEADHARMRSLLQPHFAPGRMRALRPRVEALTAGLLDGLARRIPPADLIEALAAPLPILVICELLGVPYDDRTRFRGWTRAAADVRDRARSEEGLASLFGYGQQLVARKREHPGDDVISRLCATSGAGDDEIAALSMALLFAGHETTVVGDLVLLDNGAANHDESVFGDPDRFDITRQAASHLTFGHGRHYCIGAPLARIELQAVFSQLIPRFPAMRLAVPAGELRLNSDVLTGGLAELPVSW